MKQYEQTDEGGRIVCKSHGLIRCKECAEINDLKESYERHFIQLEAENQTLASANQDLLKDIRVLKNKIETANEIYWDNIKEYANASADKRKLTDAMKNIIEATAIYRDKEYMASVILEIAYESLKE